MAAESPEIRHLEELGAHRETVALRLTTGDVLTGEVIYIQPQPEIDEPQDERLHRKDFFWFTSNMTDCGMSGRLTSVHVGEDDLSTNGWMF